MNNVNELDAAEAAQIESARQMRQFVITGAVLLLVFMAVYFTSHDFRVFFLTNTIGKIAVVGGMILILIISVLFRSTTSNQAGEIKDSVFNKFMRFVCWLGSHMIIGYAVWWFFYTKLLIHITGPSIGGRTGAFVVWVLEAYWWIYHIGKSMLESTETVKANTAAQITIFGNEFEFCNNCTGLVFFPLPRVFDVELRSISSADITITIGRLLDAKNDKREDFIVQINSNLDLKFKTLFRVRLRDVRKNFKLGPAAEGLFVSIIVGHMRELLNSDKYGSTAAEIQERGSDIAKDVLEKSRKQFEELGFILLEIVNSKIENANDAEVRAAREAAAQVYVDLKESNNLRALAAQARQLFIDLNEGFDKPVFTPDYCMSIVQRESGKKPVQEILHTGSSGGNSMVILPPPPSSQS